MLPSTATYMSCVLPQDNDILGIGIEDKQLRSAMNMRRRWCAHWRGIIRESPASYSPSPSECMYHSDLTRQMLRCACGVQVDGEDDNHTLCKTNQMGDYRVWGPSALNFIMSNCTSFWLCAKVSWSFMKLQMWFVFAWGTISMPHSGARVVHGK